jgi:hypothetical protein
LVAGDLNRVQNRQDLDERMMAKAAREVAAAPPAFSREAFSEYHLYALNRKTTLLENETKQISLLGGTGVPVKKLFVVNGQNSSTTAIAGAGLAAEGPGARVLQVPQQRGGRTGHAEAGGHRAVYQADSKGGIQFAARTASITRRKTRT